MSQLIFIKVTDPNYIKKDIWRMLRLPNVFYLYEVDDCLVLVGGFLGELVCAAAGAGYIRDHKVGLVKHPIVTIRDGKSRRYVFDPIGDDCVGIILSYCVFFWKISQYYGIIDIWVFPFKFA